MNQQIIKERGISEICSNIRIKKETLILIGFIISKFILQYSLIDKGYELHRDEYLYLDQANHLAWGYSSVPPVTSWISFVIKLLGNTEFWIKFFPSLFGALTIIIVWKTIHELKGGLYALALGATCVLFSVILRINTLYQPNSLDILCWTFVYYTLIKFFNTKNPKWLFVMAVVFAIGFLNKYNIVFLAIGFIPALLMTKQRSLLVNRRFYIAILLGLVIVLPNLIWQFYNGFPVVRHMKELTETQLMNVSRFDFLKEQLFFFAGSLVVIVTGLYALLRYDLFNNYKAFFWSFFFTLISFVFFRAKAYYAIGIYPIYIAFGSVFLSDVLKSGWIKYLRIVIIIIPFLCFIPMYNFIFPNNTPEYIIQNNEKYKSIGLLRWEDGKEYKLPQDFADMLGWKELAAKVDKEYSNIPNQKETLVLCDNYGEAGAINYYSTKGVKAVSFNADYINWFDFNQQYTNLIRIKSNGSITEEFEKLSPLFNASFVADSIRNQNARIYKTTIFVYKDALLDLNKLVSDEITKIHQ